MAFISGYVQLPTDTYDSWKSAVLGNGYDADGYYGDQCWDLVAEFWFNVGFPTGYPQTGPNQYAYECWTNSRDANSSYNGTTYFNQITSISNIKRGDVLVWNGTSSFPSGHIGFADEDYNGSGYIKILAQNQGSTGTPTPIPNPSGGTTSNVTTLPVSNFLGAFRYVEWGPTPPVPTVSKPHFKWPLYARKLRNRRNGLM